MGLISLAVDQSEAVDKTRERWEAKEVVFPELKDFSSATLNRDFNKIRFVW